MSSEYVVIYDLETTGRDPNTAMPVQIAALLKRRLGDEPTPIMNALVNPEIDIATEASDVHGITQDMVSGQPPAKIAVYFLDCLASGLPEGQTIIAGHNHVHYDNTVCKRLGWADVDEYPQIDTMTISRRLYPNAPSHQLSDLYEMLTGESLEGAHDAMADIRAVSVLIDEAAKTLGVSTMMEVADFCAEPRAWEVMPISKKHKGKDIRDVPRSFWVWMCRNTRMFQEVPDFRETVKLVAPELYKEMME